MNFNRKNQPPADRAGTPRPTPTGSGVPTASDSASSGGARSPQSSDSRRPRDEPSVPATGSSGGPVADRDRQDSADPRPAAPAGLDQKGKVRRTRVSALWIGLVVAAILAILLLIFIAQNSDAVTIRFFGWEGDISLAVAMLMAAVISVLIVAVPGSLRIGQLRRALRKNAHQP